MNVLLHDGFAFRLPELPSRYRANCSREWGAFVHGDTSKLNFSQAEKAGLTMGPFVEMALCWINQRVLTFQPNYINEPFTEIWGLPTAGGMKTQFPDHCSELSTFLLHRQSKDRMGLLMEGFARQTFIQWVTDGMNGSAQEFALAKMKDFYLGHIFRFEMVLTEGDYGPYFFVQSSCKTAETPLELAALKAARDLYDQQMQGLNCCLDPRLVDNEAQCLGLLDEPPALEPSKSNNAKRLKAAK